MHEKHVRVTPIVANDGSPSVGADAPRAEANDSITQSTCLALSPEEASIKVEDQVIALVDTKRQQNRIPESNELGQDRRLGPESDIDRVVRQLWLGQP
jgi:hypothetical protein